MIYRPSMALFCASKALEFWLKWGSGSTFFIQIRSELRSSFPKYRTVMLIHSSIIQSALEETSRKTELFYYNQWCELWTLLRFRRSWPSRKGLFKLPLNGVMSSQSGNVVTFVRPPFHRKMELETVRRFYRFVGVCKIRYIPYRCITNIKECRFYPQALKSSPTREYKEVTTIHGLSSSQHLFLKGGDVGKSQKWPCLHLRPFLIELNNVK